MFEKYKTCIARYLYKYFFGDSCGYEGDGYCSMYSTSLFHAKCLEFRLKHIDFKSYHLKIFKFLKCLFDLI